MTKSTFYTYNLIKSNKMPNLTNPYIFRTCKLSLSEKQVHRPTYLKNVYKWTRMP